MIKIAALTLSLWSLQALAAGGEGIPVIFILTQIGNLGVVLGVLTYLLRKPVINHFKERKQSFTQHLQKAQEKLQEAEKQKRIIAERISELETNKEETLKKAHSEAEDLKRKIHKEAEEVSERLLEDAKRTAEYERVKAVLQLREELLDASLREAEGKLKSELQDQDLERLQTEFVTKIQASQ